MRMPVVRSPFVLLAFASASLLFLPDRASAVARSCGGDAVANTANVLCAPPSGPCTATAVTMSANIELPLGVCELDLGGRSLRIERTLQMPGESFFWLRNASSITIAPTGKLKARADYLRPSNE
ncbi:MAG: hypothetical protein ABIR79_01460 [Candidatus Binatia bacterium]